MRVTAAGVSGAPADVGHPAIPTNPSDLACIDLINSTFNDHLANRGPVERIRDAAWQDWFLNRYGFSSLRRSPVPIVALVALRRNLRRTLERWGAGEAITSRDVRWLDRRVGAVRLRRRVAATDGAVELGLEPLRHDWDWVMAEIAASAVELIASGDWQRMKVCANPPCSWMFYDRTMNRSRQYCSMTPCGSLLRVRRFRERG